MSGIRTREEAVELLRRRIAESGLSTTRFAREAHMPRQPRTVRRWVSGESPIPQVVLEWLEEPRASTWPLQVSKEFQEELEKEIIRRLGEAGAPLPPSLRLEE